MASEPISFQDRDNGAFSPSDSGSGAPIHVLLLTGEAPSWACAPRFECVPASLAEWTSFPWPDRAQDARTVVVVDADLMSEVNDGWVRSLERSVGPVVVLGDTPEEHGRARSSGAGTVYPRSLLRAPGDLVATLFDLVAPWKSSEASEIPSTAEVALGAEVSGCGMGQGTDQRLMRDAIHEFRTPLTVVVEFASLCIEGVGGELAPKHHEYLTRVIAAARRLDVLFEDCRASLLLRAQALPRRTEAFDLAEVVDDAAQRQGLELAVELDAALRGEAVVWTDGVMLRDCVQRVLACAAKWQRGDSPLSIRFEQSPAEIRIEVRFDGVVPSTDDLAALVDQPLEHGGGGARSCAHIFGLGVVMAREFFASLGGELALLAREGEGGTFTIRIPRRHSAAACQTRGR